VVSTGDFIRVKDFQSLANVEGEVLNVYFFEVASISSANALFLMREAIEDWWYTEFLPPILAIQTNQLTHTRLEVDNMSNFETDFVVINPASPIAGTNAGPYLASATAFSFQLTRLNRTTRHGSKRIAGVPESMVDNNLAVSGATTLLASAAIQMQQGYTIEYGVSEEMTIVPVIAKTPVPPDVLPTVFNPIVGAVFRGVGSQNSRKQLLS